MTTQRSSGVLCCSTSDMGINSRRRIFRRGCASPSKRIESGERRYNASEAENAVAAIDYASCEGVCQLYSREL
jgi:hypothetical protein